MNTSMQRLKNQIICSYYIIRIKQKIIKKGACQRGDKPLYIQYTKLIIHNDFST
jgi:hypothetical protein